MGESPPVAAVPENRFYPLSSTRSPAFVPPTWYLTQAEAFARADEHGRRVNFWSRENAGTGRREFAESPVDSFWLWYRGQPPAERHCYELLRTEGGRACHLYLDCEFYRCEQNSGLDGDALTAQLISALAGGLRQLGLDVESVVELDSSSPAKFSRHLTVRLAGDVAFTDNLAAGAFCTSLLEPSGCPQEAFVVSKPDGAGRTTFYDKSVYSRNRAFRLYLSSKAGKHVRLLPTARCWSAMRGSAPRSDEELAVPHRWLFLASLASNVGAGTARLLGNAAPAKPRHAVVGSRPTAVATGAASCASFPATCAAVCSWAASRDGSSPCVRTCNALPARGILLAGLTGTRYCGNVRRQHRSNGIYVVVDYRDRCFYQKCFDPDCRNYRSEPEPLGEHAAAEGAGLLGLAVAETARSFDSWLDGLTPSELDALDAH